MDHELPTTDQPAAADTTAPAAPEAPSKGFNDLNREERRAFLDTGKAPAKATDKASDDKTADSSTAPAEGKKAAETAASPSAPASETGKPTTDKKARNSEENRVNELLEDRRRERDRADRLQTEHDELKKRLAALESGKKTDAKSDSSTTADPSEPKWKKYRQGAPDINDFDDPNDWAAAMTAHVTEQISREVVQSTLSERDKQQGEQATLHREMAQVVNTAANRLESDEKAHPDLIQKVNPRLRDLLPMRLLPEGEQGNVDHFIKDCIVFDGDHPLQLHAFYSTEEGWAEWQAMRGMGRREIERMITRRDLSFGQSPGSTGGAAPAAPAKTFTKAPPPPDKSGPKSTSAVDGAESAVKGGDFSSFQRTMDERDPGGGRRWGRRG
jgi:hypothetical protein